MTRLAWVPGFFTSVFLISGCDGYHQSDSLVTDRRPTIPATKSIRFDQIVDLGDLVSSKQTLKHTFYLSNPGTTDLHIREVELLTPCCTRVVGSVPRTAEPGQTIGIPVSISVGLQAGKRSATFVVHTDQPEAAATSTLELRANLFPEWEVKRLNEEVKRFVSGVPGHLKLQVFCRNTQESGLPAPAAYATTNNIKILSTSRFEQPIPSSTITECGHLLELELAATTVTGMQRGEMTIHWPSGRHETYPLCWEVTPIIGATPSGIVIQQSMISDNINFVITSSTIRFRILSIEGEGVLDKSVDNTDSMNSHTVALHLTPISQGSKPRHTTIIFRTDCKEQPTVTAIVLIMPR